MRGEYSSRVNASFGTPYYKLCAMSSADSFRTTVARRNSCSTSACYTILPSIVVRPRRKSGRSGEPVPATDLRNGLCSAGRPFARTTRAPRLRHDWFAGPARYQRYLFARRRRRPVSPHTQATVRQNNRVAYFVSASLARTERRKRFEVPNNEPRDLSSPRRRAKSRFS